MSGVHASIYKDDKHSVIWITDSSSCGTFVNGEKLVKGSKKRIKSGDIITLVVAKVEDDKKVGHEFIFREIKDDANSNHGNNSSNNRRSNDKKNGMNELNGENKKDIFQKYELLGVLGSGSYATVRKGINRFTGEEVAIKVIERKLFRFDQSKWEAQVKEIEIMKQLDHPSVVKLLDFYNTENILYIVVEFISGGELFDKIVQNGKYPEQKARVLVKNILEAVQYLHKKSIVHRDLKPENILLQNKHSDTDIKIVDFGVAREIDTGCKTVIGSLSYIAPEVLQRKDTVKGTGSYGESADMWSVGVITYVVLVGGLPFKDDQGMDMYKRVNQLLKFQEPYWKNLSSQAKDFITHLFQVDPKKRYSVYDCLKHPWIAELNETSSSSDNNNNNKKNESFSSSTTDTTLIEESANEKDIESGGTFGIDDIEKNNNDDDDDDATVNNEEEMTPTKGKKTARSKQTSSSETNSTKKRKPNSPAEVTSITNSESRRKSPRTKKS